jgi:WD40 repeat protein
MKVDVQKVAHLKGHDGAVYTVNNGKLNNQFLSAGSDRMVVEWSLDELKPEHVLARTPGVIYCTCLIDEFNLLLVGNDQGGIHVIDLEKRAEVRYLLGHSKGVFSLLWNAEQQHIISCGGDGNVVCWDVHDFHYKKSMALCDAKIRAVDYSIKHNAIALACGDNSIRIFDSNTLELKHEWQAHAMSVNTVCFHPNGRWLLSGSRDAHMNIWDLENDYKLHKQIPAHNYAIYSIAFHPDGKLFATASRDKTIKIWDSENLEFLIRIDNEFHQGHVNSVNSLFWTNYNKYLVSGSDDRSIIVWKIEI